jgi:aromatic ring-opening dioxygenase catalytic subunit (LigB family)
MDHTLHKKDDHEARMAKSDLLRLAKYSAKLFKMIGDNDELDGWVQEKITLAADHIGNVYHYLEYEQLAKDMIDTGPREFEESVEQQVKNTLSEQWRNFKGN